MGASQRKEAVSYFNDFATAAAPPSEDDFTNKLTLYSTGLCSGSEFSSLARPIVEQLVDHNKNTHRLQWLLQYTCKVLESLTGNSAGATPTQVAALRVAELTMRHVLAAAKGSSTQLLALLEAEQGSSPASNLCARLMEYVTRVTLDTTTTPAHAAVARLLLTLTSSALHHDTTFAEDSIDVFTEMIMSSHSLTSFLGVLLDRTVAWGAGVVIESPPIYAEGCEPGFKNFLGGMFGGGSSRAAAAPHPSAGAGGSDGGAGSNAESEATYFSITRDEKSSAKNVYASCPTSERTLRHSASLLAVLAAHQKGNGRNPAQEYLTSLSNTRSMPFPVILRALGNKVPACPAACMLLYVFLFDHPTFLHDTLRTNQNVLLGVVEKILHITQIACGLGGDGGGPASSAAAKRDSAAIVAVQEDPLQLDSLGRIEADLTQYAFPFINFMTSTLLLILSQDRVVNQLMCDTPLAATFELDRHQRAGTRLPVGSIALQVLCTGIIKAINERNEPLAGVFVPCMANMAAFTHGLDTYTSQRVVGLLLIMLRKIKFVDAAYQVQLQHGTGAGAGGGNASPADRGAAARPRRGGGVNPYATEDAKGLVALGDMLIRQLRMIVEAVEGILRGRDRNNEALIYELLYERDKIVGSSGGEGEQPASAAAATHPSKGSNAEDDAYTAQAREVLRNIISMIVSYEAEIASAARASNPREIIAVIKQCNQSGGGAGGGGGGDGQKPQQQQQQQQPHQGPDADPANGVRDGEGGGGGAVADLLYSYEESPHSYNFFGPFVWATLLSDARWPGGVLWCRGASELAIFSP